MNEQLDREIKAHLESGETLIWNGDLTLEDEDIEIIPFLFVRGDLTLRYLSKLKRIWSLAVAGDCIIEECDFLKELPRKCRIGKTLTLKSNTLLNELGDELQCESLFIENCLSLTILELGVENCNSIRVKDCPELELVTQKRLTWVPSEVVIEDCGLVCIPRALKVGSLLRVIDCRSLDTVGAEVFSGGDMEFSGCISLGSIGMGLFVGGNLTLKGTNLTTLPEDITVEGYVEVEGSSHIKNLKAIQDKGVDVRWRGKRIGKGRLGSVEERKADEIMKMDDPNKQHQAVLSLGTIEFLRQAAERFSKRKLDPEKNEHELKFGRGASDLFLLPLKKKNWEKDPVAYAAFKSVPGWHEIRTTYRMGLDWRQN
jgi:hypothetical protein